MRYQPSSPVYAIVLTFAGITAAFTAGVFAINTYRATAQSQMAAVVTAPVVPTVQYPKPVQLDPTAVLAKAAIVYDPTSRTVLYDKNAGSSLPLASLTKLMTIQTALSRLDPNSVVTITASDLAPDGDWGFKVGDTVTLNDLIRIGIIASSNDAMAAVARQLGPNAIDEMNATAQSLGLGDTRFTNPTGLDESASEGGAYGSAHDLAILAAQLYKDHPAYFELTQNASVSISSGGRTLTAAATAKPILNIPGLVGAKTGYTDLAGGNLMTIFDIDIAHPLVVVVLGSTENGRFADVRTIIAAARNSQ
jgi:D-alanyl-D-alanine carboxypeptidase